MCVASFTQCSFDDLECWVVDALARVEQVIEVMCEEHRSLRVSTSECEQLVNGFGRASEESVLTQQPGDVIGCLVDRQRWQLEGTRLAVERALLIAEERTHQRRLAAGEDVGRSLAVMLDDRSEEAVELVVRDQKILELVQADHR